MRPDFITTGSTVYATTEIVNYLKPLITGTPDQIDKVAVIERHVGRFDQPSEIKRWLSSKDSGIRIASMRVRNMEQIGGQMTGDVDFVAYVFCSEQYGYERDTRAEVIAGRLAKYMFANKGIPTANKKAQSVNMDNLYSGTIDEMGLAIWSVTWTQNWVLDKPMNAEDLDDFITLHSSEVIADGAPTMDSDITLEQ